MEIQKKFLKQLGYWKGLWNYILTIVIKCAIVWFVGANRNEGDGLVYII